MDVTQTARSHTENQEIAYIAASRRTDRSMEAGMQSARMASDIHEQRTGRRLRISEKIVFNEEMYEEEDNGTLCSYYMLGNYMHTSSTRMNKTLENLTSSKIVLASLLAMSHDDWCENDVNKHFKETFGNISSTTLRQQ